MTATTHALPRGRYQIRHVVRFEAFKILTLRSTMLLVTVTVAGTLLGTLLEAHADLHHVAGWYSGFDPTNESLTGLIVAALTGGVFGALAITGEYSAGTIRTSLAAAPRRPGLLAAKIGVTASAAVVFSELLSFGSFLLGQAVLSGGGAPHAGLATPGALRAVTMTGVFVGLLALMSFGFGLVLRSTAGAIAAFAGVVFVLQFIARGSGYTPTSMLFNSVSRAVPRHDGVHSVAPALAVVLMALYAAIALAVGAATFIRRDA